MVKYILFVIFYFSFLLSFLLGAYSIKLNKRALINRIFNLLCLSISIWSISFAGIVLSTSKGEALNWWRFSSVGWGMAYGLILHFVILLTDFKVKSKFKGLQWLIHIPSFINFIFFGLSYEAASKNFGLVQTKISWVNIPQKTWNDKFFNAYLVLYALLTLLLLIRWYIKNRTIKKQRRTAKWLIITFIVPLLIGSFTDLIANRILMTKIPSLAPIFILVPLSFIAYVIKDNVIFRPTYKQALEKENLLLNDEKRSKLYSLMGLILVGGAIFNFKNIFVLEDLSSHLLLLNIIVTVIGTMIFLTPHMVNSTKVQETILTFWMALALSILMWNFREINMMNSVWPIPLFFLMVTIVFNNKLMFYTIAVISLVIGFLMLFFPDYNDVMISSYEHSLRLMFLGIAILLTSYIAKLYKEKLEENKQQTQLQILISEVSSLLMMINVNNFDDSMEKTLKMCSKFLKSDRAYLAFFSPDFHTMKISHTWADQGVKPIENMGLDISTQNYPEMLERLKQNKIINVDSPNEVPDEAVLEKQMLIESQIQSLVVLPISTKDKVIGFIGFDMLTAQKNWLIKDFNLFLVITNMISDAIEKLDREKALNELSLIDALTKLPNRTLFTRQLEEAIAYAESHKEYLGVVLLDLDGFKDINDTLGHNWGDALLVKVAEQLSNSTRAYDTVSRFGGDEFLILIPNIYELKDLLEITNKLIKQLEVATSVENQEFYITASAGLSVYPFDGTDANALIKHADMAMYEAKDKGKNQYAVCSEIMKQEMEERVSITNALYDAIDKNQLYLYYEPQIDLKSQEILALEVLIKWEHPEFGTIAPEVFLPLASQSGLIHALGQWVLKESLEQMNKWHNQGLDNFKLAINLSIEEFQHENFIQNVKRSLLDSGFEMTYLIFEIPEGIAIQNTEAVIEKLEALSDMGIKISIDDFGMEYSSLSNLKELPVNRLKIAQKFIHGIHENKKDETIINVIIQLAQALGLKAIAEGVESKAQVDFLKENGCHEVQGVYYYPPMLNHEVEVLLKEKLKASKN